MHERGGGRGYLCTWEGLAARSNGRWSRCRRFFWHPAGCSLDRTGRPHDHPAPGCPRCGSRWLACPGRCRRSPWRLRKGEMTKAQTLDDCVCVCVVCWGMFRSRDMHSAALWCLMITTQKWFSFRSTFQCRCISKLVSPVRRNTQQYAWDFLPSHCGVCERVWVGFAINSSTE